MRDGTTGGSPTTPGLTGERSGLPRAVFLHGFGQTGACAGPLLTRLAERWSWVTPDLPGHAGNPPAVGAFEAEGRALVEAHGPAWFVGYSMGGRLALAGALARPDLVRGLVLIGVSPGLGDSAARAARRDEERGWGRRILADGLEAFFADWLAGPLFASLPAAFRFEDERRRHDPRVLAATVEALGVSSMPPLTGRLAGLARPVLLVAGARDAKFVALHRGMAAELPNATVVEVPDAGHAAHLEQPEAVVGAIVTWLEAQDAQGDAGRRR